MNRQGLLKIAVDDVKESRGKEGKMDEKTKISMELI